MWLVGLGRLARGLEFGMRSEKAKVEADNEWCFGHRVWVERYMMAKEH